MIQTEKNYFSQAVKYPTYRLEDRIVKHDHTVSKNIRQTSERITAQMQSHIVDPFHPISIIEILCNFKLACDTNSIHEGTTFSLFDFLMKSESAVLYTSVALNHKVQTRMRSTGKTPTLTTYPQVANYLLRTSATDENIADTKDETIMFTPLPNTTPSQYVEELSGKVTRCRDVYEKHDLNKIFITELEKSNRQSTRGSSATRQSASLHDL